MDDTVGKPKQIVEKMYYDPILQDWYVVHNMEEQLRRAAEIIKPQAEEDDPACGAPHNQARLPEQPC